MTAIGSAVVGFVLTIGVWVYILHRKYRRRRW